MGTEVRRTRMLRDLARMDVPHPLAQDGEAKRRRLRPKATAASRT